MGLIAAPGSPMLLACLRGVRVGRGVHIVAVGGRLVPERLLGGMQQYTNAACAAAPRNRRQLFSAASEAHLRAVVSQLLSAEGVPPAEGAVWGPIVAEAAQQVAAYLSPAMMYAGGSPDPRQVVKVGPTGEGRGRS